MHERQRHGYFVAFLGGAKKEKQHFQENIHLNFMGGACSRKRDPQDSVEDLQRGGSGRSSRSISLRWPVNPLLRIAVDIGKGDGKAPSLLEHSIRKICESIGRYDSFNVLPRDLSQQIFNELVRTQVLTRTLLQSFQDCNLQDTFSGRIP